MLWPVRLLANAVAVHLTAPSTLFASVGDGGTGSARGIPTAFAIVSYEGLNEIIVGVNIDDASNQPILVGKHAVRVGLGLRKLCVKDGHIGLVV